MKTRIMAIGLACLLLIAPAALAETMGITGETAIFADGWLYYRARSAWGDALCKTRPDGTEAQILVENGCSRLSIAGDTIYFYGTNGYHRVKTDGRDLEKLEIEEDWVWWHEWFLATGDYAYACFGAENGGGLIQRYSTEPWALVDSIFVGTASIQNVQIVDGWIYLVENPFYGNYRGQCYRVRTDGTGFERWFEPENVNDEFSMWTIRDGFFYYCLPDSGAGTAQLRRVGLDGTGDELVLEDLYVKWIVDGWAYGWKYADEITPAGPIGWGGEEVSDYYELYGAFRASLETGEEQALPFESLAHLIPVDPYLLNDEHVDWDNLPATLHAADGTELIVLPWLGAEGLE